MRWREHRPKPGELRTVTKFAWTPVSMREKDELAYMTPTGEWVWLERYTVTERWDSLVREWFLYSVTPGVPAPTQEVQS